MSGSIKRLGGAGGFYRSTRKSSRAHVLTTGARHLQCVASDWTDVLQYPSKRKALFGAKQKLRVTDVRLQCFHQKKENNVCTLYMEKTKKKSSHHYRRESLQEAGGRGRKWAVWVCDFRRGAFRSEDNYRCLHFGCERSARRTDSESALALAGVLMAPCSGLTGHYTVVSK